MTGDRAHPRRFYGRRRGKRLRKGRQRLVETLLPRLRIPVDGAESALDPASLFAGPVNDVWLEIGFGKGEHLAAQARAHPEIGFLGCEPFLDGMAALLSEIDAEGLTNIRVFGEDARLLLNRLAPETLGRVFLLFPDPWPKTRHHKRRFIQTETLDSLARVMKPGAALKFATDHPDLATWTLRHIKDHPAFEWRVRRPAECLSRPADWPETRYEEKALAVGRRPVYLHFRRLESGKSR